MSHLVRRFFDVLLARELTANEQKAVRHWLSADLANLFFEQPVADQRHGYHAALLVVAQGARDDQLIEAALLHDVGKRHSGLGVVGRSLASVLIAIGAPLTSRVERYRDHGLIGAQELARAGASRLAVEFAAHHPNERPQGFDEKAWSVLGNADQAPNTRTLMNLGITSQLG